MRAISWTRVSPLTSAMVVTTPKSSSSASGGSLVTTNCASAHEATCAKWVTTMTCALRASRARRLPSSTAALPPTPASTSSKMKVWSAPPRVSAATSSKANISRLSSPPEALLPIGNCGDPSNGVNRNAISSRPYGPSGSSALSRGVTRTSKEAPSMASEPSSSVTRAPKSAAAATRAALSTSAAARAASYSVCRSDSSSATFSGEASRSSRSNAALSRQASTSAKVGPHRRVRSPSSWIRPLIWSRSSTLPSSPSSWLRANTTSPKSALMDSSRSACSANAPPTRIARNEVTA